MQNEKRKTTIKKLKTFAFYVVVLSFALYAFSLVRQPADAQTTLPLTVIPSRQELLVDPGEKTAITIKFLNQGETPVSGLLKAVDFIVENKEGTPTFLEGPPRLGEAGSTALSPRFAAASWVTLPYDRITIAPKDKVVIQAKITVPNDAQAGGRYLAVYFEPGGIPGKAGGGEKEAAIPVAIRIAGLVYLRVSGPIEESARLVQFTAPKFLEYGPISVTTEILNLGNYHIRPKGTITLTSIFGKNVDRVVLNEENIFPDASRIFESKLGEKWMFGKYKLELAASYGETGKVLTATLFTWVFPWKIISAVILAVIITILIVALLYHRFKKREEKLEEKVEELEEKLEEKGE